MGPGMHDELDYNIILCYIAGVPIVLLKRMY